MSQATAFTTMLEQVIKSVPDYPKPGILFRDVTSLMQDPVAFAAVIDHLKQHYANHGFSKIFLGRRDVFTRAWQLCSPTY